MTAHERTHNRQRAGTRRSAVRPPRRSAARDAAGTRRLRDRPRALSATRRPCRAAPAAIAPLRRRLTDPRGCRRDQGARSGAQTTRRASSSTRQSAQTRRRTTARASGAFRDGPVLIAAEQRARDQARCAAARRPSSASRRRLNVSTAACGVGSIQLVARSGVSADRVGELLRRERANMASGVSAGMLRAPARRDRGAPARVAPTAFPRGRTGTVIGGGRCAAP